MIDYERIALEALAEIEMPPEVRRAEFDNLLTVMQAEVGDLRRSGLPMAEVEEQIRTWAELHTAVLRMTYARG